MTKTTKTPEQLARTQRPSSRQLAAPGRPASSSTRLSDIDAMGDAYVGPALDNMPDDLVNRMAALLMPKDVAHAKATSQKMRTALTTPHNDANLLVAKLAAAGGPADMLNILQDPASQATLAHVTSIKLHNRHGADHPAWPTMLAHLAQHAPNLTSLNLTDARMDTASAALGLHALLGAPALRELCLDNAFWVDSMDDEGDEQQLLAAVGALTGLTHLSLKSTGFGNTDMLSRALAGMKNLQALDLSDNTLFGGDRLDLAPLQQLQSLHIGGNESLAGCLRNLASLPDLRALNYEIADLQGDDAPYLANMPALEVLTLDRSILDTAACKHIAKMPHLETLNLRNCVLDPEGLLALVKHRKLHLLDLTDAESSQDEALTSKLPANRAGIPAQLLILGVETP